MGRIATRIQSSFRQVAAPARWFCSKETEYYNSETCWQEERREARTRAKRWPFVSGAWRAGLGGRGARVTVERVGMEGWRVLTQD